MLKIRRVANNNDILAFTEVSDWDTITLTNLVSRMQHLVERHRWIGLSSPQVLSEGCPLFVMKRRRGCAKGDLLTCINPTIIFQSPPLHPRSEGCASYKGKFTTLRPYFIRLKYLDENFKEITETFKGLDAFTVRHEMSHILGYHPKSNKRRNRNNAG